MKRIFCTVIFWLFLNNAYSQNGKRINGKIIVPDAKTSNVLVLNLITTRETYTDSTGKFTIDVKLGDLLIFQADHLDKMRKLIDEEAFKSPLLEIQMTSKIEELNEVIISNYSRINAFDLGITATRIKSLTPAERGKYSNEPRAVEFEENLSLIEKLENAYDVAFFEDLSIEKEKIKSFLYFAVEHNEFKMIAKGENPFRTRFFLMTLAMDYNALQKN
jgi:hypothetical protein